MFSIKNPGTTLRSAEKWGILSRHNGCGRRIRNVPAMMFDHGELAEWSKAHDWKSCIPVKGI